MLLMTVYPIGKERLASNQGQNVMPLVFSKEKNSDIERHDHTSGPETIVESGGDQHDTILRNDDGLEDVCAFCNSRTDLFSPQHLFTLFLTECY